jgi:hypothetical protein
MSVVVEERPPIAQRGSTLALVILGAAVASVALPLVRWGVMTSTVETTEIVVSN